MKAIRVKTISRRLVLHFPGFEPLDAKQHKDRYERSAAQAGRVWGIDWRLGVLSQGAGAARFTVDATHEGTAIRSEIVVFDHNDMISELQASSLPRRLVSGFAAAGAVVAEGGAYRFLRHAWRFGLFFLFPYFFMLMGFGSAVMIAGLPLLGGMSPFWLGVSLPVALLFIGAVFLPLSARLHVLHLFADWRLAVAVAHNTPMVEAWIDQRAGQVIDIVSADSSDEVLVTSHSMGASLAISVMARALELRPHLLDGRTVVFVTLGGAALQCGFLSSAKVLRQRVGLLAHHAAIRWIDVQCLTDPIHLYKCNTVALCGHADAPQPRIMTIRFKHALSEERYARNKLNFLRMHRQYVLGPDRRSDFDFTMLTAGPYPAESMVGASLTLPFAA